MTLQQTYLPNCRLQLDEEVNRQLGERDKLFIRYIVSGNLGEPSQLAHLIGYTQGKVHISNLEARTLILEREHVDGRTVYLVLDELIKVDGREIEVLRFKGVRPQTDDAGIAKIYKGRGTVPRALRVDAEGNIYVVAGRNHPQGGIEAGHALYEYEIMKNANGRFNTDYAVGFGTYPEKFFGGDQLGFVVAGMRYLDRRLIFEKSETGIHLMLDEFATGGHLVLPEGMHESWEEGMYLDIGRQFRAYHDAGYFHRYPHLNNIGFEQSSGQNNIVVLRDLDGTVAKETLSGDSRSLTRQEAAYRFIDLARLVHDVYITKEFFKGFGTFYDPSRLIRALLNGYFHDNCKSKDFESLLQNAVQFDFSFKFEQLIGILSLESPTMPQDAVNYLRLKSNDPPFGRMMGLLYMISS